MGIKIFGVIVTMHNLPDEVVQQRLANWRAPWESKREEEIDKRKAKSLQRMKRVQAETQVEIIQEILENIEEMRLNPSTTLPQAVNLSIMEALDEAIARERRPPKS
jgi:hypothetical protein